MVTVTPVSVAFPTVTPKEMPPMMLSVLPDNILEEAGCDEDMETVGATMVWSFPGVVPPATGSVPVLVADENVIFEKAVLPNLIVRPAVAPDAKLAVTKI